MLENLLFKRFRLLFNNCVGRMLKQMLKPFELVFNHQEDRTFLQIK